MGRQEIDPRLQLEDQETRKGLAQRLTPLTDKQKMASQSVDAARKLRRNEN